MSACTAASAFQLVAAAFTFLLDVLWFERLWVRIAEDLHHGDIAAALHKRTSFNAFVAIGVAGAAAWLLVWVDACTIGSF